MNVMSDRAALKNNVQTRAFRSLSFNRHPPLGFHRSRRTLSLPTREKPAIPPVITENSAFSPLVYGEPYTEEEMPKEGQPKQQQILLDCYEIGWVSPVVGLLISLLLYAWACFLSLSSSNKEPGSD